MNSQREIIKRELNELLKEGMVLVSGDENKTIFTYDGKKPLKLNTLNYQLWYTKALRVIEQILPNRAEEFENFYKITKRKEINYVTYTISDYLVGTRVTRGVYDAFDTTAAFIAKFQQQMAILNSAYLSLDSILLNITDVLHSEILDNEIGAASNLLKAKHLRAAGTVAGVVLEGHLSKVCENHQIKIQKKDPTIGDYNEALKNANILDVPNWRWIQRLSDIRNLCLHKKDRDPTIEEVEELINGVEKAIKTLF